jgi:hypothetical protein
MFLLGILIFKGLTARRLYKSFDVKGLTKRNSITRLGALIEFQNARLPNVIQNRYHLGWELCCNYIFRCTNLNLKVLCDILSTPHADCEMIKMASFAQSLQHACQMPRDYAILLI